MQLFKKCSLAILMFSLCSCASVITENITSDPSGASIYWGKDKYKLSKTPHSTPSHRQLKGLDIEPFCYQVIKEGYNDPETVCKPREYSHRYVHFNLEKIEEPEIEENLIFEENTVSTTGAASTLRKLTTSETYEINPRLSPDKKWLLMQVYEAGDKASYKSVLQKLNIANSNRIILTQKNYTSRNGTWLPDNSAIVFDTDRIGSSTIVQSWYKW